MNLVEAEVTDGRVQFAGLSIPLTGEHVAPGRVMLGIRPQDFSLAETADAGLPTIEVEPAIVEELGSATHAIFHIEAPPVDTRVGPRRDRRGRLDACCSPPTGARSSRRRSRKARRSRRAAAAARRQPGAVPLLRPRDRSTAGGGRPAGLTRRHTATADESERPPGLPDRRARDCRRDQRDRQQGPLAVHRLAELRGVSSSRSCLYVSWRRAALRERRGRVFDREAKTTDETRTRSDQ